MRREDFIRRMKKEKEEKCRVKNEQIKIIINLFKCVFVKL